MWCSQEHDEEQLSRAAEEGQLDRVKYYLRQKKTNPNAKDEYNQTPLLRASANGHDDVVRLLLLEKVIEVDAKSVAGQTPLYVACENQHVEIVECLLKQGANANAAIDQSTLLHSMQCQTYDPVLLERKEIEKPCFGWRHGNSFYSPNVSTRKAGVDRTLELSSLLLKHGAEVNAVDTIGRTPLHWACFGNVDYVEAVKLLLDNGAHVDAKDIYGQTPLYLAISKGYNASIHLLLERGADINGQTLLHLAIPKVSEATFRMMLEYGADVHVKDRNGRTPLQIAESYGQNYVDVLKPFVKYDSLGQLEMTIRPLQQLATAAKDSLDPKVIALGVDAAKQLDHLIPLRQSPRFPSADYLREQIGELEGEIPQLPVGDDKLHRSIKLEKMKHQLTREMDAQKKLKDLASTPTSSNARCDDPELCLAVERGLLDKVIYYLSEGSKPDARNAQGRTILSVAVEKGYEAIARFLLEYDSIDFDAKDADGRTPLYAACANGRQELALLLLKLGATIHVTIEGQTPLEVAQANGFHACVATLETFAKLTSRQVLEMEIKRLQGLLDSGENSDNPSVIADATRRLELLVPLRKCRRFSR